MLDYIEAAVYAWITLMVVVAILYSPITNFINSFLDDEDAKY